MAVGIDKVYQKVQALISKEQRGYLTPTEFNLFADQAQKNIFDQYFYDLHQFKRRPGSRKSKNDPIELIYEKLLDFRTTITIPSNPVILAPVLISDPSRFYSVDNITAILSNGETREVSEVHIEDKRAVINSPLTKPTINRPIYSLRGEIIELDPSPLTPDITYVATITVSPTKPEWNGYNIGGAFAYNQSNSNNFDLHPSEEVNLVNSILKLAGVALKDPSLYQIGSSEEAKVINQEKQ